MSRGTKDAIIYLSLAAVLAAIFILLHYFVGLKYALIYGYAVIIIHIILFIVAVRSDDV